MGEAETVIREAFALDGCSCILCRDVGAAVLIVQPVDARDLPNREALFGEIRESIPAPLALAAFGVDDWNRELSPWCAPPVFGDAAFGGGAPGTLSFIERRLLPEALRRCGLPADAPAILGGYSLAGLFALWAATQTDRFRAVAAASPSVWFPGWIDFAKANPSNAPCIYQSLGDREPRTRNRAMATVGDKIQRLHQMYLDDGVDCRLEWHAGNHFQDVEARCAKAFSWCLNRIFCL